MRVVTEKDICDRCGREIEKSISDFRRRYSILNLPYNVAHLEVETLNPFIYDTMIPSLKIDSCSAVLSYQSQKKDIELCSKCKKAFEKFMVGGD